jgi:hypothetical protein
MSLRAQNSEKEAKMLTEQLEDLKKQLDEVRLLIHMLTYMYHSFPCRERLFKCSNSFPLVLHFGTKAIVINI